jgi:hypothetical protein
MKLKIAIPLMLTFATLVAAHAEPVTQRALIGTWDTNAIAMFDQSKPGAHYAVDSHSFVYTFTSDGKWIMQGKKTEHHGTYQLLGSELVLKNDDGSIYQDWQAEFDGKAPSLLLKTDKMTFTLDRVTTTP